MKKLVILIVILSTLSCNTNKVIEKPYWTEKTKEQKQEEKKQKRKEILHDFVINTIGITVWFSSIMVINKIADSYKP